MILVGLTGGIGAGKSTVSAMLAARGAVIVDADAITHQLQQPGMPVVAAMAERFGPEVLGADGALDRAAVARIVFNDPGALKDLGKIVHPAVNREIARQALEHRHGDGVVVLDIPLLLESDRRKDIAAFIVVDIPTDVAVERLVRYRGMPEDDARARIARQAPRDKRLAAADFVVDNSGDQAALARRVDELWAWILARPAATPDKLAPMERLVAEASA
jgi:dephospho-CoA kinase